MDWLGIGHGGKEPLTAKVAKKAAKSAKKNQNSGFS
jgi:hypothetical protein